MTIGGSHWWTQDMAYPASTWRGAIHLAELDCHMEASLAALVHHVQQLLLLGGRDAASRHAASAAVSRASVHSLPMPLSLLHASSESVACCRILLQSFCAASPATPRETIHKSFARHLQALKRPKSATMAAVLLSPSRRRDCHFAAPSSIFSRCFNMDGEIRSAK